MPHLFEARITGRIRFLGSSRGLSTGHSNVGDKYPASLITRDGFVTLECSLMQRRCSQNRFYLGCIGVSSTAGSSFVGLGVEIVAKSLSSCLTWWLPKIETSCLMMGSFQMWEMRVRGTRVCNSGTNFGQNSISFCNEVSQSTAPRDFSTTKKTSRSREE